MKNTCVENHENGEQQTMTHIKQDFKINMSNETKHIEVKINIDELCTIKAQSDAMEFFQKLAEENVKKVNRLMDEINALRAELNKKNPDCNGSLAPVMPKDIEKAYKAADRLLFAEDDSHAIGLCKDEFGLSKYEFMECVSDLVESIAKYFKIPRGGSK